MPTGAVPDLLLSPLRAVHAPRCDWHKQRPCRRVGRSPLEKQTGLRNSGTPQLILDLTWGGFPLGARRIKSKPSDQAAASEPERSATGSDGEGLITVPTSPEGADWWLTPKTIPRTWEAQAWSHAWHTQVPLRRWNKVRTSRLLGSLVVDG